MTNEEEIASFIAEQVRAAQRISGARLGLALSSRVPDFRLRFGTLRSFVEKFCAAGVGVIPPTEKGDVVYVPASMLSSMQAAVPKPLEAPDSAWRAFTAPNSLILIRFQDEPNSGRVLAW